MALTKEQSLREAIAHEETQLAKLADKYNKTQERLASLKTELATMEPTPPSSIRPGNTNQRLYTHYRGRKDFIVSPTIPRPG